MNRPVSKPEIDGRTSKVIGDRKGHSHIWQESLFHTEIPVLEPGAKIRIKDIRDKQENKYLAIIWAVNMIAALIVIAISFNDIEIVPVLVAISLAFWGLSWISWKLMFNFFYGHSIEVGPDQYPQIYRVVSDACKVINIPAPTVLILQGHGMFELFVAKRFSRRGVIILTSNMVDEFAKRPTSRELMMYVGMQLGHIKAGHFDYWFFKEVIGKLAFLFHTAWKRRCKLTADRVGLLVAGDLYSAEQALFIVTAGVGLAPGTNYDAIVEQHTKLFESFWAWLRLAFCSYPYMVDRIVRLHEFAESIGARGPNVGALPIEHTSLKALPILIIHGHDRTALLELKDFIYSNFPQVVPRVMVDSVVGAASLPEKFETIANDIVGAIALLTPDDTGSSVQAPSASLRTRQNVVVEIGWVWSKLGRNRLLLLARGNLELPSDLSGSDIQSFHQSPQECSEAVRQFVGQLINTAGSG